MIDLNSNMTIALLVKRAAGLGALHAMNGRPALKTRDILAEIISPGEGFKTRNGHWRFLRTAYGAGYNAVKFNNYVTKRELEASQS